MRNFKFLRDVFFLFLINFVDQCLQFGFGTPSQQWVVFFEVKCVVWNASMESFSRSVGLHFIDWWYVVFWTVSTMLTDRSHWSLWAMTLNFQFCTSFRWLRLTLPMVCACFRVTWSILIPDVCISSVMSWQVKAVPLSVSICIGTQACCVNICTSARTTDVTPGLRSGTANRNRGTHHRLSVRTCIG